MSLHSEFTFIFCSKQESHAEPDSEYNKAYRPNAHLLYIVMHYNGNII